MQFQKLDSEYPTRYRNNLRILVRSSNIANYLWDIIKKHLMYKDIHHRRPYGFHNEGYWIPVKVNEVLRVSKYKETTYFSYHIDGNFLQTEDLRSIFTVIVYLNDSMIGGETALQAGEIKVKPETGTILVINHDMRHAGLPVLKKVKYIIRTDILFRRTDMAFYVNPDSFKTDPKYLESLALFQQAEQFENNGDIENSLASYIKGLEIQSTIPSYCSETILNAKFPAEIWENIYSYLTVMDRINAMKVSKGFYDLSRCPRYWFSVYKQYFPVVGFVQNPDIIDWFYEFKMRVTHRLGKFYILDIGTDTVKVGYVGKEQPKQIHNILAANRYGGTHNHCIIAANSVSSRALALDIAGIESLMNESSRSHVTLGDVVKIIRIVNEKSIDFNSLFEYLPCSGAPMFATIHPGQESLFNEKSMSTSLSPTLAARALNRKNATFIHVGHGNCYVSLIVDDTILTTANFQFNGRTIDTEIQNKKKFSLSSITKDLDELACKDLKERFCQIPTSAKPHVSDKIIPSGIFKGQTLTSEVRMLPTDYFFGADPSHNLPKLVLQTIETSNPTLKKSLLENMILVGGMTLIEGFLERFEEEMRALPGTAGLQILEIEDRQTFIWKAASLSAASKLETIDLKKFSKLLRE
uniref:Fe2OG dioxygenase domain-containing protein n=1 Tax=Arcella intermedia TaxID=1963864 RepID=A0A6B2KZA6_9EUKA